MKESALFCFWVAPREIAAVADRKETRVFFVQRLQLGRQIPWGGFAIVGLAIGISVEIEMTNIPKQIFLFGKIIYSEVTFALEKCKPHV